MQRIDSPQNARFKRWKRLCQEARFQKKEGAALLEGAHLAESYFATRRAVSALLYSRHANAEARYWIDAYARRNVPLFELSRSLWHQLEPVENGIGLMLEIPTKAGDTTRLLQKAATSDVLYLDGVQDAGNVGTMIRTAVAAGVRFVVTSPKTAGLYTPKVLRAGMGAHFGATCIENVTIDTFAQIYQGTIVAADARGGKDLFARSDAYAKGPLCWIMGAEGPGVSEQALSYTQQRYYIPIDRHCESLNVGAAAAICLFDMRRRRHV